MRRLLAAVAALGLVGFPAAAQAGTLPPTAVVQVANSGSAGGVQSFGSCLSSGGKGDLLLLVDQSGSLHQTDPSAARVSAADYLLQQLARNSTQAHLDVQIAVAGFDIDYGRVVPWTRLSNGSVPGLTAQVAQFANRNSGIDTDYVNALQGARSELLARSRAGRTCQAVLWFTDGRYDVQQRQQDVPTERKRYAPGVALDSPDGVKEAQRRGRASLCRPGGVADQLRAAQISVVAVGLGNATDFGLLGDIALGADNCGNLPARGDLSLASELDGLFQAVDRIADPSRLPVVVTDGLCSGRVCPQKHRFVLDQSVRAVHVLADAGRAGVQVHLQGPGPSPAAVFSFFRGAPLVVPFNGQQITASWLSPRTLDLTLDRRQGDTWPGLWSVTFVEPSARNVTGVTTRTQLRITGDLVPAVAGAEPPTPLRLAVGGARSVSVLLRSEVTGREVPLSTVQGTAVLSAVLRPSAGDAVRVGAGDLVAGQPAAVDLSRATPGSAVLSVRLSLRTRGLPGGVPGTQLADRVVDVQVVLVPPPHYPVVAGRVDLGTIDGGTLLHGQIVVTGPGCVWLEPGSAQTTTLPDGARKASYTSPTATSAATCREVGEGQQAMLPLLAHLDRAGNGSLNGTVLVQGLPARGSSESALASSVSLVGEALRPVDTSRRLAVFLVLLVAGIVLPLAFLYAAKWWTARIPGLPLLVGVVQVRRDGQRILRNGSPLHLHPQDVHYVQVPRGGTRSLPLDELDVVLRTTPGGRPAAAGEVIVQTTRAAVSGSPGSRRVKGRLRLPLTVHGTWVGLVHDSRADDVDLLLLMAGTADASAYERAAHTVDEQLPRQLDLLRVETNAESDGTGAASEQTAGVAAPDLPGRPRGEAWSPPPAAAPAPAPWDAPVSERAADASGTAADGPSPPPAWDSEAVPSWNFGDTPEARGSAWTPPPSR